MKPIQKKTLHQEISSLLRDMIIHGDIKEGEKLKEDELCKKLRISKTPLREAIRVLTAEGLVTHIPNKGSFVTKPTFEEIKEMFDVMCVLEGVCAREAAKKVTPKELRTLEALHSRLEEQYQRRDQQKYIKFNNQYHSFVQEVAGNRVLNSILNGLRQKILIYRFQSLNHPERFEESIKEHRDLLEAFRKKDPDRAESVMKNHLWKQFKAVEILRGHSSE